MINHDLNSNNHLTDIYNNFLSALDKSFNEKLEIRSQIQNDKIHKPYPFKKNIYSQKDIKDKKIDKNQENIQINIFYDDSKENKQDLNI